MSNKGRICSQFVNRKIQFLSETNHESFNKAMLAKLRRGVGKNPADLPELWAITLDELPEELLSSTGLPTQGEWATHTALTLYALHQQGKDTKVNNMHINDISLGRAIRRLIRDENDEVRVKRRFNALITSDQLTEVSQHLRGLIQLMKGQDIAMDYGMLTEDLFWYQFDNTKDSVRLKWGQDFYRFNSKQEENQ